MADITAMERALRSFVSTVDNTGGIKYGEDGVPYPVADEDWVDVACAYEEACDALGRPAKVAGSESDDVCHQCGKQFVVNSAGVANHLGDDGDIDHDADADHVPYNLGDDDGA